MFTKNYHLICKAKVRRLLLVLGCALLFILSGELQHTPVTVSASPLPQQGSCPSVVLPSFKLPWNPEWNPNGSKPKIYFTGGPHKYELGGQFTATYDYGLGSGLDFAAGGKPFNVAAMADGQIIAADCTSMPGLGCIIAIVSFRIVSKR